MRVTRVGKCASRIDPRVEDQGSSVKKEAGQLQLIAASLLSFPLQALLICCHICDLQSYGGHKECN
jgi:hypothetical protein